ncbi:MAG TPA: hypothetical protein VF406_04190 [Thermodesulfobacteriota bacterium]
MAGSFSDFLENELLDHVFGAAAYTAPATLYIALFTAAPTDAGGGTEVSTGVWTNYARVAVTNNATNFPAASGGAKSNGTLIDFGTAAISGAAPTVVAIGVYDAAVAGNLLAWCDAAASKTINNGDPVTIPNGDLDLTLT